MSACSAVCYPFQCDIQLIFRSDFCNSGYMKENTTVEQEGSSSEVSTNGFASVIWWRDWILLLTIPTVLIADQVTKFAVKSTLRLGESWPAEGFIRLTHGSNTGTAFGLLPNQTLFLIFASIFAIGFLGYFYYAYARPRPLLRFAIGLQFGGAFGNLFDRVVFGAVTDFIDVGWWPIFNIADSSICVGMATLIIVLLLFDRKVSDVSTRCQVQSEDKALAERTE